MLEAVSLDLGNTFLFEVPPRHAIYAEASRSRGRAVSDEAMRRLMKRAHQELPLTIDGAFRYTDSWFRAFIERIFHQGLELGANDVDDITAELFERFEDPATFRTFPGALELLQQLREAGLKVGFTSNWSARLPRLLNELDLLEWVDFLFCSALEGLEKPDPRVFTTVAERCGTTPMNMLHAGDHLTKDGAAAEVGMQVVIVDHFGRARSEAPTAELRVVRGLDEVGRIALELKGA